MRETIDLDFLGDAAVLEGVLSEYVRGNLDKTTMKERPCYSIYLDMERIKKDVRMN